MRLQWLAIGITLVATFSTFGYPLLFDRLFIGLLIVTALVSFKWDKNLFTLCLIFIAALLVEETAWVFSAENRFFLIPAYAYLLFACYICKYSKTGKLTFFIAILAIAAEVYWISIDKTGPRIFWHALVCANLLVVKHLVLFRPHFCSLNLRKYSNDWKITISDIDLGYVIALRMLLELANIFEYLLRHITHADIMLVYESYSVLAHAILAIEFYIFLRCFSETIKAKVMPA